jgi:hypothetical protein
MPYKPFSLMMPSNLIKTKATEHNKNKSAKVIEVSPAYL